MKKNEDLVPEKNVSNLVNLGQNDIPALLTKVESKIKALTKDIPKEDETNSQLEGFGSISTLNKVETLVKAYSMLCAKKQAYEKAAKELEIDINKYPFSQNGHSFKSWTKDIKKRVALVRNKTELDKLKRIKTKLESNLSAELKLAKDLAEVQNILLE